LDEQANLSPMRARLELGVLVAVVLTACDGATIIHNVTRLGDTRDHVGPYSVLAEVSDPDGVEFVSLFYQPGLAGTVRVEMAERREGIFEGDIPGQPPGTRVRYFVVADDGDDRVTAPADALAPTRGRYAFAVLTATCTTSLDCDPGETCDASGSCVQTGGTCKKDSDCGKGFRCGAGGSCVLATRPCHLDEGCLMGEVCDAILGQCIPRPTCDQTTACPLDFNCSSALGVCLRACMGTSDCGPGETCKAGTCSGGTTCQKTTDCKAGLSCDPVLKLCRPAGAGLCAKCTRDVDCGGTTDFCILYSGGQYCGRDCSAKACPGGYTCNKSTTPPQCTPSSGSCQ
jgi:hypothetical protein